MISPIRLSSAAIALVCAFTLSNNNGVDAQAYQLGEFFGSAMATYYGDGKTRTDPDPAPIAPAYGACGFESPINPNYFAALSQTFYNARKTYSSWKSDVCGQCALVTCAPGSPCPPNTSTLVQIVDSCPGCPTSPDSTMVSLDLSHVAFGELVGGYDIATSVGKMAIQWQIVDCPSDASGFGPNAGANVPPPPQQTPPPPPVVPVVPPPPAISSEISSVSSYISSVTSDISDSLATTTPVTTTTAYSSSASSSSASSDSQYTSPTGAANAAGGDITLVAGEPGVPYFVGGAFQYQGSTTVPVGGGNNTVAYNNQTGNLAYSGAPAAFTAIGCWSVVIVLVSAFAAATF